MLELVEWICFGCLSTMSNLCILKRFYAPQLIPSGWSYLFVKIIKIPLNADVFFVYLCVYVLLNRRLTKVINILSNNQPPCPQLYLYSTADQVIPVRSVEYFIQEQKSSGKKIWAYNFGSSPHVDHYRSFPRIYSAELHKFLKECISDCFVHLPHNPKIVPLVSPESKNP